MIGRGLLGMLKRLRDEADIRRNVLHAGGLLRSGYRVAVACDTAAKAESFELRYRAIYGDTALRSGSLQVKVIQPFDAIPFPARLYRVHDN